MKNKLLLILLGMLVLLIPFNVDAASVSTTSIVGPASVEAGDTLSLNIYINFDGVDKNSSSSSGVWAVLFDLYFDQDIFTLTGVDSTSWTTGTTKEKGYYEVESYIKDSFPSSHLCVDGYSYCSSYQLTMNFKVNMTTFTSATFEMGDVGAFFLGMLSEDMDVDDLDISYDIVTSNATKTVKINNSTTNSFDSKSTSKSSGSTSASSSSSSSSKDNENEKTDSVLTEESYKSKNNYLGNLNITGYELDFNKFVNNYDIYIEDDVNSLEIDASVDNEKATMVIVGSDDLKNNDYQVLIKVTSEDGEVNTYVVNTLKKSEVDNSLISKIATKLKIDKKYLYIVIGLVIGLIILLIIIKLIIYLKNRKIEKALDNL